MNLDLSAYGKLALNVLSAPGQFKLEIRLKDNAFTQHEIVFEPLQFGFGDGPGIYEFPIVVAEFELDKVGALKLFVFPCEQHGGPHPGPYKEDGLYRFGSLRKAYCDLCQNHKHTLCSQELAWPRHVQTL
jgi:hypothetical protein